MHPAAERDVSAGESLRTPPAPRSVGAAVALFFVAPLVAEFLLGNLPVKLLPALVVLAPLYGGGALLIREWTRRTGRGWPSILLLGMAYALVEEAFTTQSLFNRNYLGLHLGLLEPAYLPALGIGGWWTLWMLNVHAIWSISTPIALVEAAVPDRAQTPWLRRTGFGITAVLFAFGLVANTVIGYKHDHFRSSPWQFSAAAAAILLLVLAALRVPRAPASRRPTTRSCPPPLATGLFALLLGSAALLLPMRWGWGAFAALLALDLLALAAVLAWSRSPRWHALHTLSLAAGAALAYGWHAFLQHPAVGALDRSVRVGNVLFLAGAVALIVVAWRRTTGAWASSASPLPD